MADAREMAVKRERKDSGTRTPKEESPTECKGSSKKYYWTNLVWDKPNMGRGTRGQRL